MPKTNKRGATVGTTRPTERPDAAIFPDQDILVTGRGRVDVEGEMSRNGVPVRASLLHDWDADGWAPFEQRAVSLDGSMCTATVETPGRGTILGPASSVGGNHREVWMRDGTDWEDSEILTLWRGGSTFSDATARCQLGQGHRMKVHADGTWSGIIITNNMFLTEPNVINAQAWRSNAAGTTLTQGTGLGQKTHARLNRAMTINSTQRFVLGNWINSHTVTPVIYLEDLAIGDLCNVNSNDSTFNATAVALTGVDPVAGSVSHDEPTTTSAVALRIDAGTLTPPTHKKYWPYWVRSRLIGNELWVKVWRYLNPEPSWSSSEHVLYADFGGAQSPLPAVAMPTSGRCGLVSAHQKNSSKIHYEHFECWELAGRAAA